MGKFYESVLRPFLFRQEAEKAHENAVHLLQILGRFPFLCRVMEWRNLRPPRSNPIVLFGLPFPNRVGLAAGLDKNAKFWPVAGALGFGHVEIGTVTNHPQQGNPRPRLFRYPEQEALINRMGFNNDGAAIIEKRLGKQIRKNLKRIPLGINIGKSRIVRLEQAAEDYLRSYHLLAEHADYFTINVSSPNTPQLRKLQGSKYLPALLEQLASANNERARKLGTKPIPMLVKISPDLTYREIDSIMETVLDLNYDGIIATNTALSRPVQLRTGSEPGGLSGRPLQKRSTDIIRYISKSTQGKFPIVGVGGIMDFASAGEKIDAGASLIQIYTGWIYRGPFFARNLARSLAHGHKKWI